MHAHFQELLALRDAEPVDVEVRRHVAHCDRCGAELRRLSALKIELQRLPMLDPSPWSWNEIRARLDAPSRRPSRYGPALAAAGAMAACLIAFLWMMHGATRLAAPGLAADAGDAVHDAGIAPLVAHSQKLEALLRAMPPRPAAEKAVTSATIDELQTRIQLLDAQLSGAASSGADAEQVRLLWNDRVRLLNSLVYVRYAESAGRGTDPLELGVI